MWQMKVVLIPLPSSLPDIFLSQLSLKKPHDDNNVSCVIQNVFVSVAGCYSLSGAKSKALTIDSDSELAKPQHKQRSTRTLDRSLSCFPHASHSISHSLYLAACLVFSPPLLVWWLSLHSLCSSRTPHSALSAVSDSDRTSQTAAMTDITLRRLCLRWLISSLFPSLFRLLFTRTALNRLRLASSKDYHNHHLSLPVLELIGLYSSIMKRRMWLRSEHASLVDALFPVLDCQSFAGETEVATPVCRPDGVWWDGESERKRSLGCFPHPERPVGKITESLFDFCSCIQKNLCN